MHTFRIGPRMVINAKPKTANDRKESDMLEATKAPPVIMSIKNKAEEAVAAWYAKHSKKKLTTQSQQEPLQFFKAPPVIMKGEE